MGTGFSSDYLDLNGDRIPSYKAPHNYRHETSDYYQDENNEGKDAELDDASESGDFFQNAGDEKEQIKRLEDMNDKALVFFASDPMYDGQKNITVVEIPEFKWYQKAQCHRENVSFSYKKQNRTIPACIKYLDEHKLRVEYSPNNEMVKRKDKEYPTTRWYTVIFTNPIAHDQDLLRELQRFTRLFKQLNSAEASPSPGRRFMNFVSHAGFTPILNSLKGYMGEDENIVESKVNAELIEMGKKAHKYRFNATLDKFLPDYYIKRILQDHFHATSWDTVSEKIKRVCYKSYPNRELPVWDQITAWTLDTEIVFLF